MTSILYWCAGSRSACLLLDERFILFMISVVADRAGRYDNLFSTMHWIKFTLNEPRLERTRMNVVYNHSLTQAVNQHHLVPC